MSSYWAQVLGVCKDVKMILFIEFNPEEVGSEGQGHVWRPDVESDDEMEQVQDVWGERKYLCDTYKYFLKSSIYCQLRTLRVIMKIINELTIFVCSLAANELSTVLLHELVV